MSLSSCQLAAVVEEIDALVLDAPVRKAFCADEETFVLEARAPGKNHLLLFSLTHGGERTHFVASKPTQPPEPASFVMLLRKHLVGARLRSVKQLQGDRIVSLEFERGPAGSVTLLAELLRRGGNIFLLGAKGELLGSLLANQSHRRRLVPGARYVLPEPPSEAVRARSQADALTLAELPADGQRSAKLETYYGEALSQRDAVRRSHAALRRLRREQKTISRRAGAVEKDLDRAHEAQRYRKWGELLQSAHGQITRGTEIARVPDYYVEGTPEVEIPLDVKRDLRSNIDHYFKLYRKFQGAVPEIQARLERTIERLEGLGRALGAVEGLAWLATAGEVGVEASKSAISREQALAEIDEQLAQLETEGLVSKPRPPTPKKAQAGPALPYREFQSKSGRAIFVGKGAKQNDRLTVQIARGHDLWLHAHDWAGAHVVVRLERHEEIDQESLLDAATLAAHYSGSKNPAVMEVIYTFAKHVRKPKGFPPGKVTVSNTKAITVRMEDERLRRLLVRD